MSEFTLHVECAQLLEAYARHDVEWWHCPMGEKRTRRTGARLQRMGAKAGVFDFSLLVGGAYHEIELKTATGRISKNQERRAENIQRAGGSYHFARSLAEFSEIVQRIGALRVRILSNLDACGGRGVREGEATASPKPSPRATGVPT